MSIADGERWNLSEERWWQNFIFQRGSLLGKICPFILRSVRLQTINDACPVDDQNRGYSAKKFIDCLARNQLYTMTGEADE